MICRGLKSNIPPHPDRSPERAGRRGPCLAGSGGGAWGVAGGICGVAVRAGRGGAAQGASDDRRAARRAQRGSAPECFQAGRRASQADVRRAARRRAYEVSIDVQGLTKSAVWAVVRAHPRAGSGSRGPKRARSARCSIRNGSRPPAECLHVVRRNLCLLEPLGDRSTQAAPVSGPLARRRPGAGRGARAGGGYGERADCHQSRGRVGHEDLAARAVRPSWPGGWRSDSAAACSWRGVRRR